MIAIIAEKPSVGQEIARVVGATEKKDGYITGNGYMVTWALGHLVSLALPGTYGYTRTTAEDLPMLPEPFRLVERQIRTDRGMVTDIAAGRQLKVIDGVFSECDSIIVATDAGREGELIFRWIYSHLGCTKPFKRLWFSSLTDEAIRKGMADLREGYEYDSLYAAADSRAKADWLVGMNASRALAAVSGSANNSIGRVQTPTLAMICARFKENRNFVSTPYWQLHITLKQGEAHRLFIHPEHFGDKKAAETAYGRITEIVAHLTGAAGTLDFATDTYGAASNVVLPFSKITEGDDAGKWKATVQLLGVTGTEQLLTGEIRYADGNPTPTTLKSDLTEALKEFNTGKGESLTLGGTLVETPEGMEVDGAEINGWEEVKGDDVNADL